MNTENGINRRNFLEKLGVAAAAGLAAHAFGRGGAGSQPASSFSYIDSFGNISPVSSDLLLAGITPPNGMFKTGTEPDSAATSGAQMNILLIIVDQLRNPLWLPPGMSVGSYQRTAMQWTNNNLINKSYFFPYYYPAATTCTAARATLVTGLYSQQQCIFVPVSNDTAPVLQG